MQSLLQLQLPQGLGYYLSMDILDAGMHFVFQVLLLMEFSAIAAGDSG